MKSNNRSFYFFLLTGWVKFHYATYQLTPYRIIYKSSTNTGKNFSSSFGRSQVINFSRSKQKLQILQHQQYSFPQQSLFITTITPIQEEEKRKKKTNANTKPQLLSSSSSVKGILPSTVQEERSPGDRDCWDRAPIALKKPFFAPCSVELRWHQGWMDQDLQTQHSWKGTGGDSPFSIVENLRVQYSSDFTPAKGSMQGFFFSFFLFELFHRQPS